MYLNMDTRIHHSRECLTHSRTHAYTHSIQLCVFVITPSRTHNHWRHYAKEPACKGNRQPGALLYYNSHNIHYIIHIWLIFLVKQVQDHSTFWDQYLSQSHAHRCAELYLSSIRRRSASFRGNAMEPLVYDTVINANRTGHLIAVSWALCREADNVKSCTYQSVWTAILRKANVLSDYTGH